MGNSRYGEMLGLWELRIGGFDKDLRPQMGDNKKLLRIMTESKKRNDDAFLMEQIGEFIKDLIARDHPPRSEEEKKELDIYVEFNIIQLMKELLVVFRWATRDDLSNFQEGVKKNP